MDDYWLKFYGPAAAAPMKAYWMGIDEAVTRYRGHSGSFFGLQEVYSPEFIAVCRSRLDAAAKAAKGDRVYSERVALAAEGLQSAVEHRRICDEMSRGEFQQALATYQQLTGRLEDLAAKRYANPEYATAYLRRMLQKTVERGAAATAAPNKVLQVLPDQWLMTYDDDDQGEARGLHRIDADTSGWKRVATWSRTLSSQGLRELSVLWYRTSFRVPERHGRLAIFFGEVDGTADVYVNGTRIPVTDGATPPAAKAGSGRLDLREGQARRRTPFEVDVTAAVHPGENVVVVRADNRKISELFLGGIVRPAVVVEQAAGRSEREVGGGK
jgi:hypothetical protein